MQPITRINANDPVIFSDMNLRFNEIEARDNEQQQEINALKGVILLTHGADILASAADTSICPLGEIRTFRVFNSQTSPYANGDNDFIYHVDVAASGYLFIKAIDVRSNRTFNNSLVAGIWTGWEEDSRVNKLGELFGNPIMKQNESIAQVLTGNYYRFLNATAGFPSGYVAGDNDFLLLVLSFTGDTSYQRHLLLDVRSSRMFTNATTGNPTSRNWREI